MSATSEWRPMATASKGGDEILIVMPGGQSDHYHVMYWDADEGAWVSRYHDGYRITETDLAECFLMPMWAEIHDPPSSLCAGPGIPNATSASPAPRT